MLYRLDIFTSSFEVDIEIEPNNHIRFISIDGIRYKRDELEKLPFRIEIKSENPNLFNIFHNQKSFDVNLELIENDKIKDFDQSLKNNDLFSSEGNLIAPMPGKIKTINCKVGDTITEGKLLLVFEAMKMENEVRSSIAEGVISSINVKPGDSITTNQILLKLKINK